MLLNSYQNFIGVCGSISNSKFFGNNLVHLEARDGFLDSLCSFGSKNTEPFLLNEKNVQICKTLLNIAHCLGSILDVRSWYIVLECMQRVEGAIKKRR
jgi:hypothetical protein